MARRYEAYLIDTSLDPKKGQTIDAAFYPAENDEQALLIAQARWQEELKQVNRYVKLDNYQAGPLTTFVDEDEDD
jgi:hypothetical protein